MEYEEQFKWFEDVVLLRRKEDGTFTVVKKAFRVQRGIKSIVIPVPLRTLSVIDDTTDIFERAAALFGAEEFERTIFIRRGLRVYVADGR